MTATAATTGHSDPAEHGSWVSASGNFLLSFRSDSEPPPINRIHAWTLHLGNAQGEPVANAEISVSGGMPEHDHGLPTAPRVTGYLGQGDYRLEGMRFHMSGDWELTVDIRAAGLTDTVTVPLRL